MDETKIWRKEQSLWTEGADAFGRLMADDAVMAFAQPIGIMQGEAIVESLKRAPRWETVEMEDRHTVKRDQLVIISYRATGRRAGQEPYEAYCTSVYVEDGSWAIISHQQTPIG